VPKLTGTGKFGQSPRPYAIARVPTPFEFVDRNASEPR
jgi:hypothetical protein